MPPHGVGARSKPEKQPVAVCLPDISVYSKPVCQIISTLTGHIKCKATDGCKRIRGGDDADGLGVDVPVEVALAVAADGG